MKDRPILFSGPMVRALLEGRKTQTRRVVKSQPQESFTEDYNPDGTVRQRVSYGWSWWPSADQTSLVCCSGEMLARCPYGVPGDRLWVKHQHWRKRGTDSVPERVWDEWSQVLRSRDYAGDLEDRHATQWDVAEVGDFARKPSIYMPRWASRITLEVVGVRVERVEDITEADAMAEGAERNVVEGSEADWEPEWGYRRRCVHYPDGCECFPHATAREWFLDLFYGINKRAPKGINPWVWVIEFKRVGGGA